MIVINSKNTIGNITILDESINGKYKLKLFLTNNNFYNVNDFNKMVYVNVNLTDYQVELTNGFYTPTEFIAHLENKLSSATGEIFTITKNDNTRKFTTTCNVNFSFTFGTNTRNSASKLIGVDGNTTSSTSLVSPYKWDLSPLKVIFCTIHEDKNKHFNTNVLNASFIFSTNAEFGGLIKYPTAESDISPTFTFSETQQISVDFTDVNGNKIDLDGQEWLMFLEKI